MLPCSASASTAQDVACGKKTKLTAYLLDVQKKTMMAAVANARPNVISRFISCTLMDLHGTVCFTLAAWTLSVIANLTPS